MAKSTSVAGEYLDFKPRCEVLAELATRAVRMGNKSAEMGNRSPWSSEDLRVAMAVYCPEGER